MLEQVRDLREEGDELYELLKTLDESVWEQPTLFKSWTVQDVVEHLHFSDRLAVLSLKSDEEFLKVAADMGKAIMEEGLDLKTYSRRQLGSLEPSAALKLWRDYFVEMCDLLEAADPNTRLKWFGPDMGVRMFTTARQMETWAHGQEIYDLLGVPREYTDRLKNIAVIGVVTAAAGRLLGDVGTAGNLAVAAILIGVGLVLMGIGIEFAQVVHLAFAVDRPGQPHTHVGLDQARRHHVDMDAVGELLLRQRECERLDRRLAHAVRRAVRPVAVGCHRRDHHDVATIGASHPRQDEATGVMCPHRMRVQHTDQFVGVGVGDRMAA